MKFNKILPYALLVLLIGVYLVTSYDPLSAKVSGKIFWNDELLTLEDSHRGKVVFRPVSGGANCTGAIDTEGNYTVGTGGRDAIAPGDYLISLSVVEVVPAEDPDQLPEGMPITPKMYASPLTSGLTLMVKSGENVHDIRIEGPAYTAPPQELAEGQEEATEAEAESDTSTEEEVKDETNDSVEENTSPEDITSEIKDEVTE